MAQQIDPAVQYHGRKRPAESEPEDQPLAKRFGRLHIGKYYILDSSYNPTEYDLLTIGLLLFSSVFLLRNRAHCEPQWPGI